MNIIRRLFKPRPKFKVGQHIRPKWWKETQWSDRHLVREVRVYWSEYECYECGAHHSNGWVIEYAFANGVLHEHNHAEWECAEIPSLNSQPSTLNSAA